MSRPGWTSLEERSKVRDLWRTAKVRPMTIEEAVDVASWRYSGAMAQLIV
ncbi:hypothetical protein ACFQWH_14155 [Mycolicibacterium sp. GCM10028919]